MNFPVNQVIDLIFRDVENRYKNRKNKIEDVMKKNNLLISLVFLLMISITIGCAVEMQQMPTLQVRETEKEEENTSRSSNSPQEAARFTIESDPNFKEPVSILYQAFFDGEAPVFVDQNADLLVAKPEEDESFHYATPAYILPGAALFPLSNLPEIQEFINFSLSAAGQEILVDVGLLAENIILTDQAGNQVEIELPVRRVLSAYGPVTSIVYSVDAEDRFVSASYLGARDPLGSSVMAKIDPRFPGIKGDDSFSQSEFNIEQAASLNPDLILANARSSWLDAAAQLDIPVFLYDPETPELLKEAVLLTGQIFGPHSTAQAQAWVKYFEAVVEEIGSQVADIPEEDRLDVLFTGTEPLRVASGDMFQSFIIDAVGGISVTSELEGYWNNVNLEQVVLWEPEVIIVPPYGGASVDAITESQEWQILDTVQNGRVYRMPKLVVPWDTPAPDAVLGIIWMGQRLYPEQVDLNCAVEAEYFYQTFYDYEITEEEIGSICTFK